MALIPNISGGQGGISDPTKSAAQSGGQFGTDVFQSGIGGTVNIGKKDNLNTVILIGGVVLVAFLLMKN